MRLPFVLISFISLFLLSCNNSDSTGINGNWLIVYPDHSSIDSAEREIYGKMQDSIVSLYGLKMIKLHDNGDFIEMDSILKVPGKWHMADSMLIIMDDGKGFEAFETNIERLTVNKMRLSWFADPAEKEIRIVWHLKKISTDEMSELFSADYNTWRKKPLRPESETEMKKRLAQMLEYYSRYFKMVSKEASYFIPDRVLLPFKYYQKAIGMDVVAKPGFNNLFYNVQEAVKAYNILYATMRKLSKEYPKENNFVLGYAAFMHKMADDLH